MQFIGNNRNTSEGNTRRLQRESEDDETPQGAFFATEEAHREPAESVVYFRSGKLLRNLYQPRTYVKGQQNLRNES
ncbi:hypothetical protein CIL05_00380 [Virgibacillus profundi]|uniref:Uncharacterized protein n=1 Tax=Virgibacillus profundi TaxID=2024555 RepID=A0A2A2IHY1_9BACI|nr:hypothetical protein CIL05_00380 [Virgibacillus profundi]PXY55335.1 hypothetical protein CIT14_00380 [Virgibacillus profundi]